MEENIGKIMYLLQLAGPLYFVAHKKSVNRSFSLRKACFSRHKPQVLLTLFSSFTYLLRFHE